MFLGMMAGAAAGAAHVTENGERRADRWISYATQEFAAAQETWTVIATTCRECPAGCGIHVRCHGGRAIKAEGNPSHPVSHGGLCPRGQSSPQGLYDPDRVKHPLYSADGESYESAAWAQAIEELTSILKQAKRLFIVSDLQTGALAEVMQEFHRGTGLPGEVVFYEAFACEALRAANGRLFGRSVIPYYNIQKCDVVLSFGADFLESWISDVEYAWQFSEMHHRHADFGGEMLYVGPRLSMTAANADHFLQIPAGQEYRAATAVLHEMSRLGKGSDPGEPAGPVKGIPSETLREVARRFVQAENSVAVGGPIAATGLPAEKLTTAVMLMNQAAGRIGSTVDFSRVHALCGTTGGAQLRDKLADLGKGDVLIIHQANPAYSMPTLGQHIERAGHVIFLGPMMNETARLADWVLPVHSPLEAWGDYEPWTGIHCLMQPVMGPLHDTRHSGDIFLDLARACGKPLQRAGQPMETFCDWLMMRWRQLQSEIAPDTSFESFWQKARQGGGVVAETKDQPAPNLRVENIALEPPASPAEGLHLWLRPSILHYDGRMSNRGWLQEVPDRTSTIAWQSWVDISPVQARQLGVADGDVLELSGKVGQIRAPARVTDEVTDNIAALAFGQGHTSLGEVADNRGANAFELLTPGETESLFGAVSLRKTGRQERLIALSATQDQYGRDIIQWSTRQELGAAQDKNMAEIFWPLPKGYEPHRDLYPPHEYPKHRWAMVVDLDRCIGCGACAVACYAENNIPVMGPVPLMKHRQLAWLQIPPYRHPTELLRTGFLPLPCQHCDAAPCEPVCPVFAAVHNDQGLNAQIYNRCIGTRYCSNNCPYKVRRFGWFNPQWRKPLHLQLNPDVDVRCRGVMEKCTFCVQRILGAERQATVEGRPLRDGEIQPACVQSCPTKTYVFGDLMQPDSQVSKLFEHPRRYQLLKELNTKPAVLYLKRILSNTKEMAQAHV
jgi:anaerobic selenocysteine-containing dehydrogenase/Fe-S-cluster-containing dehydrogenase component